MFSTVDKVYYIHMVRLKQINTEMLRNSDYVFRFMVYPHLYGIGTEYDRLGVSGI